MIKKHAGKAVEPSVSRDIIRESIAETTMRLLGGCTGVTD
jgi:hypothetical protein